jgi:hypothetical protein
MQTETHPVPGADPAGQMACESTVGLSASWRELGHTEGTASRESVRVMAGHAEKEQLSGHFRAWALRDSNPRLPPCKRQTDRPDLTHKTATVVQLGLFDTHSHRCD